MIKDEIYKIQKEIIIDELKIDLANDVLSIEKKGGDRHFHTYSEENDKIYNKSIEKAVNKLVDDDLSLEDIKRINMEEEKKYIIHRVLGDLGEEELEKFIENKKENIEDNLKIELDFLSEKLEQIEEKEQKKVIKNEKEIENKENTKEIELI